MNATRLWAYLGASSCLLVAGALGACGGGDHSVIFGQQTGQDGGNGLPGDGGALRSETGSLNGNGNVQSLAISPAAATLTSTNGAIATQPFTATVTFKDGTHALVTSKATWSADSPQVGKLVGPLFTANGAVGGVVHVSATYQGLSASATLTVSLHVTKDPLTLPAAVKASLTGATNPDASVVWAYPYDQTVSPKPGVDPSHPPFHLTGQVETNLAMRGFWSLPPCAADGATCATGTDCCGGFCSAGTTGAAAGTCQSTSGGCAENGDRCSTSSDCCDATAGVTCINHVCSEPPPR